MPIHKSMMPLIGLMAISLCPGCDPPVRAPLVQSTPTTSPKPTSSPGSIPGNTSNPNTSADITVDTEVQSKLVNLIKQKIAGIQEATAVNALTLEHARQIANDSKQTDFKLQANYNPVAPGALQTRLLQAGVYSSDNLVNAYLSDGSPEAVEQRFLKQLDQIIGPIPFSHYSVSVVRKGGGWYVSAVLLTQIIRLEGLPLNPAQIGAHSINGEIQLAGFKQPQILITRPDGVVQSIQTNLSGNRFNAQVFMTQTGLYSFEVNVVGPLGPLPASNFIVAVGVPYPKPEAVQDSAESVSNLEQARNTLLNLINQDRQALGFSSLKLDAALSQAAQAHCDDMVQNHFIGHNSPTQGTPQQQAFLFKVTDLVAQNIAVSRTLKNSQRELMSSPGHRKTILEPNHSHIGLGVSTGEDGFLYITQLFTQRKLEVNALPTSHPKDKVLSVSGKSTQDGFVALFLGESVQGEPVKVTAGGSFNLPISFNSLGKQRIRVGFSEPPPKQYL